MAGSLDERWPYSRGVDKVTEQDLRTIVREFRASVSDELHVQQRRMTEFQKEVRERITMTETAILNTVSDMGREMDRRFTSLERHAVETDARLDRVEDDLGAVKDRLEGVEGRLEGVEGRLEGVEGRLEGVEGRLEGVEGRLDGLSDGVQELLRRLPPSS